jgi:small conductance mechanosensitive channel
MIVFRKTISRLLLIVSFVVLSGATTVFAAEGQASSEAQIQSTAPAKIDMSILQEIMTRIYTYLAEYGLKIVGSILIFIVGRWLTKLLSSLAAKAARKAKMDETLVRFIQNFCYLGMLTFVIIAALANMGVQTASFIAVIAAGGLAIGLALQGSLANFASGVLMLIFKPIRVGDFVEAGGAKGTVSEIGIFTTIVNSPDNVRIIIPNSQITSGNVSNYTINGTRRVDMVIGVSYEDDLKKTKSVIEKVLADDDRVLPNPAALVAVFELADSSVNFVVRPWVNVANYWDVYFDLTAKIKVALDKNGITIPFPQQDIHMKNGTVKAAVS